MPKQYDLSDFDRATLEKRCTEVTRANGLKGPHYFIGQTADENGSGHALVEVGVDGKHRNHWGSADDYLAQLAPKAEAKTASATAASKKKTARKRTR
jgi:hypothetical protein